MFPKPQHNPASTPVESRHSPVSFAVSVNFPVPEGRVRLGSPAMIPATVPETRIEKDEHPRSADHNIGRPVNVDILSISNAGSPERCPKSLLKLRVALLNKGH